MLRAELRKLIHQRANWVMLAGAGTMLGLFLVSFAFSPGLKADLTTSPDHFLDVMALTYAEGMDAVAGIVLLVASARLVGLEYSDGTIRVVLAHGVGRLRFLVAKLTALGVFALGLMALLALLSAAQVLSLAAAWHVGSPTRAAWLLLEQAALVVPLSMASCVLLAVAAAITGRSTAFGVGVAMAFFPADNAISVLGQFLHSNLLIVVSQYLLGPNLNALPSKVLGAGRYGGQIVGDPVSVDSAHILIVVGCWCGALLLLAILLIWKRDVQD